MKTTYSYPLIARREVTPMYPDWKTTVKKAQDIITLQGLADNQLLPEIALELQSLVPHGNKAVAVGYAAYLYAYKYGPIRAMTEAASIFLELSQKVKTENWKRHFLYASRSLSEWTAWSSEYTRRPVPTGILEKIDYKKRKTDWPLFPQLRTLDDMANLANFLLLFAGKVEMAYPTSKSDGTCEMVGLVAMRSVPEILRDFVALSNKTAAEKKAAKKKK